MTDFFRDRDRSKQSYSIYYLLPSRCETTVTTHLQALATVGQEWMIGWIIRRQRRERQLQHGSVFLSFAFSHKKSILLRIVNREAINQNNNISISINHDYNFWSWFWFWSCPRSHYRCESRRNWHCQVGECRHSAVVNQNRRKSWGCSIVEVLQHPVSLARSLV